MYYIYNQNMFIETSEGKGRQRGTTGLLNPNISNALPMHGMQIDTYFSLRYMTAFYKKTDNQLPFYQREYTDYIIVDDIDNMPWLAEEEMPWAINEGMPQVGEDEMPQVGEDRMPQAGEEGAPQIADC